VQLEHLHSKQCSFLWACGGEVQCAAPKLPRVIRGARSGGSPSPVSRTPLFAL
jgi:hypothetical protein